MEEGKYTEAAQIFRQTLATWRKLYAEANTHRGRISFLDRYRLCLASCTNNHSLRSRPPP
jgi:hypothetical protein